MFPVGQVYSKSTVNSKSTDSIVVNGAICFGGHPPPLSLTLIKYVVFASIPAAAPIAI
jgi:hypothetical protein